MEFTLHRSLCIALVALLVSPTIATACPIPFRTIGPLRIVARDIARPVQRRVERSAWGLDETWTSTRPELNQRLVMRSKRVVIGATYAQQRALSIDAAAPSGNGWVYADDEDAATAPCSIVGLSEWQKPVIMVRESPRRVRIAAASQRTPGDRTGCVLGGGGDVEWGCPTLTRAVIKLARPLGARTLLFESFR